MVSEMDADIVKSIFMEPYTSVQEAYNDAIKELGQDVKVLVMPYGGSTLPVVNNDL
jgi:nickel-dependent lactate racemase